MVCDVFEESHPFPHGTSRREEASHRVEFSRSLPFHNRAIIELCEAYPLGQGLFSLKIYGFLTLSHCHSMYVYNVYDVG